MNGKGLIEITRHLNSKGIASIKVKSSGPSKEDRSEDRSGRGGGHDDRDDREDRDD